MTTNQLRIKFRGACTDLAKLSVVVQGEDGEMERENATGHGCNWTVTTTKRFSTDFAFFSLRTAGARTDCQKAVVAKDDVAELTYGCCNSDRLRAITITTNVPTSYLRDVPTLPRPCVEHGNFSSMPGNITHVQFKAETIYLQLGRSVANTKLLGLRVDDLPDLQRKPLTRNDVVYRLLIQRAKAQDKSAARLVPNAIDIDLENLKRIRLERLAIKVN
ncbi:MAG TPA: hypothetical protein VKB93_15400 [Thermoanaerobaculia bacterium]|nr:hypothetical protein [Thermoanaerobaculia bacterium]